MKKKLALIFVLMITATALFAVAPFFALAEETPLTAENADFRLTYADGTTVVYLNVDAFADYTEASPTYVASADGTATLEMLRDVTSAIDFRIYGNVDFDGGGHTYLYTGKDYAFWTANAPGAATNHNIYPDESEMKRAKFENLKLTGIGEIINPETEKPYSAGGFKFYNSILELGEGNVMATQRSLVITPRNSGKVIISGGSYSNLTNTAIFQIGGDTGPSGGPVYPTRVSFDITGGTLYSDSPDCDTFRFVGSSSEPSSCTMTVSGGDFYSEGYNIGYVTNGNLNIEGGNFYGNIRFGSANVNATVSGGNFPVGCMITGGSYTLENGVEFTDPTVARVYLEGESSPAYELTRSEFIVAFGIKYSYNIFNNELKNKNYTLEILEDFGSFRTQLGIRAGSGNTVTVKGNGKTITGRTLNNPILRAYGPGNIKINEWNLYNHGASCFQFYESVTVDLYRCIWSAPNHRVIFPTNSGVVNINDGCIIRGGDAAIYFNILVESYATTVNVNTGAVLIGTENTAIAFQSGSLNGTVNIAEGAQVRVQTLNENVIQIPYDSDVTDDDGNVVHRVADNNVVNIDGGTLEGKIANYSESGENIINFNSGILYTSQTEDTILAQQSTHFIKDGFVIAALPTDPYYIVSIPSVVTITPEKGYDFNIMADFWRFSEFSQLCVSVESANGFVLNCSDPANTTSFTYNLISSQTGNLESGCLVACFGVDEGGSAVTLRAEMTPGQQTLYAGEYSDVLTFSVGYTDDEASVIERPHTDVDLVQWNDGFIASDFYTVVEKRWQIVSSESYKYSDLFIIPKAGTTVTFKDYYAPNDKDPSVFDKINTPYHIAMIFTTWECKNGEWAVDIDWRYDGSIPGWVKDDTGLKGTPTHDLNLRGYRAPGDYNHCLYAQIAGTGVDTIDGVERGYVLWSYTTSRDNETMRLCFGCEEGTPLPTIMITEP